MEKLKLIITNEYLTDIRAKSFWIATLLVPILMVAFGGFGGMMMSESDSFMNLNKSITPGPEGDDISGSQIMGMMMGIFLTIFIMMYGSQIFNKVKVEKCNRIVEVLATCVDGSTMMLAKIISVALVGITQILIWFVLLIVIVGGLLIVFASDASLEIFANPKLYVGLLWSVLYFIGGYIFFGSLFAAVGAMTDKNNENQEYVAVLTFLLLGSFYIGEYAVDNGGSAFARICSYVPFTSPTVGCVNAVTGSVPLWESLLSILSLYLFAAIALSLSGKIYTSSLLLRGKKFTPRDIITFLKSK